jgi:hypothetical protein
MPSGQQQPEHRPSPNPVRDELGGEQTDVARIRKDERRGHAAESRRLAVPTSTAAWHDGSDGTRTRDLRRDRPAL